MFLCSATTVLALVSAMATATPYEIPSGLFQSAGGDVWFDTYDVVTSSATASGTATTLSTPFPTRSPDDSWVSEYYSLIEAIQNGEDDLSDDAESEDEYIRATLDDLHQGPFFGQEGNGTCGYLLLPGSTAAPLFDDCVQAINKWSTDLSYHGNFGRQTQVAGTCVAVWYPFSDDFIPGRLIQSSTLDLAFRCRTGDALEYVCNYSWAKSPGGDLGWFSLYNVAFPEDGPPDA